MDATTLQKLQQFLRAARALQVSIDTAIVNEEVTGVGRVAVKQYNGIQRKIAELVPDDFYITDTLTLDVEEGMSEEAMAAQVRMVTSQLIVYVEGLIRENRQPGTHPTLTDVDGLRNLSDQIINMTKATIRRAMSNVDVDFNFDFDSSGKPMDADLDLEGADLANANYSGRDLRGVNLSNANLRGANFTGARMNDADLEGVDAEGANFSAVNLRGANLSHANFTGANLTGVNLRDGNLEDVNFMGARLEGANFSDANLERANLSTAHMEGCNLRDANLDHANLRGARLDGANLRGANLEHADLTDVRLNGATLRDASLEGAILPENFQVMGTSWGNNMPRPPHPPRPPVPPVPPMGKHKVKIQFDSSGLKIDTGDDANDPPEKPKNDDLV